MLRLKLGKIIKREKQKLFKHKQNKQKRKTRVKVIRNQMYVINKKVYNEESHLS